LRHRRTLLGMTQQQLANTVGIRFQQIQKYESGANRISASRLWDLASALGVPVSFFFEELNGHDQADHMADNDSHGETPQLEPGVMNEKETLELVRAYYGLEETPRQHLLALAKSLSSAA